MPSPDVKAYVNLSLLDADAQDIVDAALASVAVQMPGWVAREGDIGVVLISAMAEQVALGIFAINRLPGTIFEILLQQFQVYRDVGAPPQTTVTFTASDSLGHTVPADTTVQLDAGGLAPVSFTTTAAVTIPAGTVTGTVAALGTAIGAAANGVPAGTVVQLVDAVPFVEGVVLASAVSSGRDTEADSDYFTRATQQLSRLVSTLVLPEHFEAAALATAGVYRARGVNNFNPASGNEPGVDAGHMSVAVLGPGGAPLTVADKAALLGAMQGSAAANLGVHIVDPSISAVDVAVTAVAKRGWSVTAVQGAVLTALRAYLNPLTWDWSGTVWHNNLITLISGVAGVDYVLSLDEPTTDVPLTGPASLANAGALTVVILPGA